jgi:hypothetical protein
VPTENLTSIARLGRLGLGWRGGVRAQAPVAPRCREIMTPRHRGATCFFDRRLSPIAGTVACSQRPKINVATVSTITANTTKATHTAAAVPRNRLPCPASRWLKVKMSATTTAMMAKARNRGTARGYAPGPSDLCP